MSDYYVNPKNVQEQFTMRVGWDLDLDSYGEGCHGQDLLLDDDPIEIKFSKFRNGEIQVVFGQHDFLSGSTPHVYFLSAHNALFKQWDIRGPSVMIEPIKSVPSYQQMRADSASVLGGTHIGADVYSANQTFYTCYQEAQDLNPYLTDHQKAIVERFFAAVRATFPDQFARK